MRKLICMSLANQFSEKSIIVFIHGAGLRASVWDSVRAQIDMPSVAIDFPQRGEKDLHSLTFESYVASARTQLGTDTTTLYVFVCHSIGTQVGLALAQELGERVIGFVSIASVIPQRRGSFVSGMPFPQRWVLPLVMRLFGTRPPASAIRKSLSRDASVSEADALVRNFTPESVYLYTTPVTNVIEEMPTLYIKTTNDLDLSPQMQDAMISHMRAKQVVEIASGHYPMLSHPKELAEALAQFVQRIERNT